MDDRRHLPALDGVRGLAILAVMIHNVDIVHDLPSVAGRLIALSASLGWIGVQLFFALSGFLITRILLASKGSTTYYKSFFARRVLRIFPVYYGTLVLALIVFPRVAAHPPDTSHQVWLWVYLSNWTWPSNRAVDYLSHFWSLAVEEQWYLVWPFVVGAFSSRALSRITLGIAAVALAVRIGLRVAGIGPEEEYMWTVCRMDALALGALGAVVLHRRRTLTGSEAPAADTVRSARWLLPVTVLATVLAIVVSWPDPRTSWVGQTVGYTVLAAASAAFVFGASANPTAPRALGRVLSSRPLTILGRYSYGMYVYHLPLHVFVGVPLCQRWFGERPSAVQGVAYIAGAIAVSLVVAAISYELVESRFLALKRRFSAEPGPAPTAA